jgi:aminopeptidase N
MLISRMFNKIVYSLFLMWYLLPANTTFAYTRADTLRGSNGPGRSWWDVQHYGLSTELHWKDRSVSGRIQIDFLVTGIPGDSMQIDLQDSLEIAAAFIMQNDTCVPLLNQAVAVKDGNVWWIKFPFRHFDIGHEYSLEIFYKGKPREAKNPPWDGGFIWTKDASGMPWISVACQGLGASSWFPCKDIQSDEPDSGMSISLWLPFYYMDTDIDLVNISNGRLVDTTRVNDDLYLDENNGLDWHWKVSNPINTYDASFYIGDYVHWQDTIMGEKGELTLDFYALRQNEKQARTHFEVTKHMLHCFEYWLGPYPFYEDGYKLVEAPFLGMEHQSAIAYGNKYQMGYLGKDRSNTGVGLNFDFIIIHESGHEWFGNSITAADIADNWIHEGFTTYTETLFAESLMGKEKAFEYVKGQRLNIKNDKPLIGPYGVNKEGSGDIYDKGATLVHTIRLLMNDDEKFRQMLRTMNERYYHKMVSTAEIEEFLCDYSGIDLLAIFNQYLRTTKVPELTYYIKKGRLYYKFNKAIPGFTLPIEAWEGNNKALINPNSEWQSIKWKGGFDLSFSDDFYFKIKS